MHIRPLTRADFWEVAIAMVHVSEGDSAFEASYPHRREYPLAMLQQRLRTLKRCIVEPIQRCFVVIAEEVDVSPGIVAGQIIGLSIWARIGDDKYVSDKSGIFWYLEHKLQAVNQWYFNLACRNPAEDPTITNQARKFHRGPNNGLGFLKNAPHWHLGALYVVPAAQGKGIGSKLLDWGMDLARKETEPSRQIVALHATPKGRWLYEKRGFRQVGTLRDGSLGLRIEGCVLHAAMLWDPNQYFTMPRDGRGPDDTEDEKALGYKDYVLFRPEVVNAGVPVTDASKEAVIEPVADATVLTT